MRIYYLINGFNGGGAAFPIPDLVESMRGRGHVVKVWGLMLQDGKARARLNRAGIAHEVLGGGKWDLAGSFIRLIRSLRQEAPDLIWTSLTRATLFGQLAGKMLDIPVVSWQHSAFLKPANRFLVRMTKNLSRRWITDSENVREFAVTELGISKDRIDIWPMFHALADVPQARPWLGSGPIRVGSLGRLHRNKRFDCLVRVAARIGQTHPELSGRIEFVVGGMGPELERLEALCKRLSTSNVHFVGHVDRPADFLKELHIYIQTSHHEGLCIAAHEAMQAALPVIATRVGQLRYSIVEGDNGLLCDVGDVDGLAEAVVSLVQNPARARAMGIAGRKRVMDLYSEQRFQESGRRLLEALESVLGSA